MNKFRNNLHPAFLIEKFDGSYNRSESDDGNKTDRLKGGVDIPLTRKEMEEFYNLENAADASDNVIDNTKKSLDNVQTEVVDEILKDSDFSKVPRNIISEKKKAQTDKEKFRQEKETFDKRLNEKNSEGKKYSEVWNEKIKKGFDNLIKNLNEKKYFEDKSKRQEMATIKAKYFNKVKDEYKKIWDSNDSVFNEIKDTIFNSEGQDALSSKLFNELTKEPEISGDTRFYHSNAIEDVIIDPEKNIDSQKVRNRIKFLANELPNDLWEIKSRGIARKGWSMPLGNVTITKAIDRPSDADRQGLEDFIRSVDKLSGEENINIELKLIDVFKSLLSKQSVTNEELLAKLKENNLSLQKEKDISLIKKAYIFYKETMTKNPSVRDQHRIYLSVMDRIEKQGGFDKTIAAYKEEVDKYKEDIKKEKKGKEYEKGKKLDKTEETKALKAFADALNIAVVIDDKKLNKKMDKISYDYTRVTRLSEKSDDYFKDAEIVDILADLNNDGKVRPSDSGVTKTGTQFKESYERAVRIAEGNENVVLDNLFAQAKLYNSNLGDQKLDASEFTKEEIRRGNKKLILLLQSIIADPGQDFFTLLQYGPDSYERDKDYYDKIENMDVDKAADEIIQKYIDGPVASHEGLHQAVAGALFEGYTHALGLGASIPFDKWVEGLAFNAGVQTGEGANGKPFLSLGLNLSYNKEIPLKKGWSITPGASVGFIPLFNGVDKDGNAIPFTAGVQASAGVEIAKQWVDKNAEAQKVGGRISISYTNDLKNLKFNTLTGTYIMGWERDKLAGIEQSEGKMKEVFKEKIMKPLLDKIAEKVGEENLDLTKEEHIKYVNDAIDEIINTAAGEKKSEFSKKHEQNIKKLKENTVRLLINYNNAPIINENVRKYISNEMSERYAAAWTQQRIDNLDGKTYLSGARLGASIWYVVGTNIFGATLHAGLSTTKHEKEGYGDKLEKKHKFDAISEYERNDDNIKQYNRYLKPEAELRISDDKKYVVLSPEVINSYNVLINKKMKGRMKKDESGNVLLSVESYISGSTTDQGTAAYSITILVGGQSDEDTVRLNDIINDPLWFTDGEINTENMPGREIVYTREKVDKKLVELKKTVGESDKELQEFDFPDDFYDEENGPLKTGGKYKIILEKNNGKISYDVKNADKDTKFPLVIEYISRNNVDLMRKEAQEIAQITYDAAQRVKSNALRNISHGNKRPEYVNFANQVKAKDYKAAKKTLIDFIPTMNALINQKDVDFSPIINLLNNIGEDEIALGQALLSINNIFARVASVQGGGEPDTYHFRRYKGGKEAVPTSMDSIIKERAGEIKRVIDQSPDIKDDEVKKGYIAVIDAMEEYRVNNPEKYKATSGKRKTLDNAVGINLGNGINVENPLFNPEIYADSEISLQDLPNFQGKNTLQERAMEIMAKDKSLMGPVLESLKINISDGYSPEDFSYNNGELTFKINGHEVKFKANMSVGYFSQCVNHMILLKDVKAEYVGGQGDAKLDEPVSSVVIINETTAQSKASTITTSGDVAIGLGNEEGPHGTTPGLGD